MNFATGPLTSCRRRPSQFEKAWAGLRPGSFDTYPYIGKLPDKTNVFVAAGHYRAGIHLSAGTAGC